jgi:hypothetical protein
MIGTSPPDPVAVPDSEPPVGLVAVAAVVSTDGAVAPATGVVAAVEPLD